MKYKNEDLTCKNMLISLAEKTDLYGITGLTDLDLTKLAFSLEEDSVDTKIFARTVTECIGKDIQSVYEEFLKIDGIDKQKARSVAATLELARRYRTLDRYSITSPKDVYREVRHYADDDVELFVVVALNGAHEIIFTKIVSQGLVNRTLIHPREVFCDAIKSRATAVVLVHNHPSQKTEPSPEDKTVTSSLVKAGDILGIKVLDHLIISKSGFYSFLDHNLIN